MFVLTTVPFFAADLSQVVEGRYIVMFRPEAGDVSVAAGQLANEIRSAAGSAQTVAAAAAQTDFEVVSNLGASSGTAVHAKGTAAAAPRSSSSGVQGLVVKASASSVQHIRSSQLVSAVFPDRIVAAQQHNCIEPAALAAGVKFVPSSSFKWPKCITSQSTQLVWHGERCGSNGSLIRYTRITAVDSSSQSILATAANGNQPCVLVADAKRPAFTRQRLGGCGVAPTYAPDLPTRICTATGGNSKPAPTPSSPSQSPSPVVQPSPVPEKPEVPRSGPTLPRVPVVPGDQVPAGVSRIEAVTAAGAVNIAGLPASSQVVVGVVDSGVDGTHPDINYAGGQSWVAASTTVSGDAGDADFDLYGHGTHVAGTIGAKDNGAGVVGVSAGVPVFSLKVLDGAGRGTLSNVLSAVKWVAGPEGQAKGIKVINLSLAAYVDPNSADYAATRDAVCGVFKEASDAGVMITVAAGNYGAATAGYLPASCPSVVAVTAMDPAKNTAASFSNFMRQDAGSSELARVIAAPGVSILSTVSYAKDASGYRSLSGTSMASPHVAGVAANCIMSGACNAGVSGLEKFTVLQEAAKERLSLSGAPFGFSGDAANTLDGKYYGFLAWGKF